MSIPTSGTCACPHCSLFRDLVAAGGQVMDGGIVMPTDKFAEVMAKHTMHNISEASKPEVKATNGPGPGTDANYASMRDAQEFYRLHGDAALFDFRRRTEDPVKPPKPVITERFAFTRVDNEYESLKLMSNDLSAETKARYTPYKLIYTDGKLTSAEVQSWPKD